MIIDVNDFLEQNSLKNAWHLLREVAVRRYPSDAEMLIQKVHDCAKNLMDNHKKIAVESDVLPFISGVREAMEAGHEAVESTSGKSNMAATRPKTVAEIDGFIDDAYRKVNNFFCAVA